MDLPILRLYCSALIFKLGSVGGIVGGGWAGMGSLTVTSWFKWEKAFKLPRRSGGYFRNEADHRDFVSIGTAAGDETFS